MNEDEINALIKRLVETRYPYEVEAVLKDVPPEHLVTVVGAALYRTTIAAGRRGAEAEKAKIRGVLGL